MSDSEHDISDSSTSLRILVRQDLVQVEHDGSLESLAAIQRVMIEIDETFTDLTEIGLRILEATLGAAINLQSINIERLVQATTSIPVQALTRILRLQTLSRLTDLRVLGTRLEGNREEWRQLAALLDPRNVPCLEFICMVEPLAWLQHIPAGALDPLLRVCANHSSLKFLATNLFSGVSLEAIDDFCKSPQIMGLHLVDTNVSKERVLRLLRGLQTNTKVWFLSVAFAENITSEQGKAIASLLRNNNRIANMSIKSKKPIREELVFELVNGLGNTCVEEFSLEGTGEGPAISDTTRRAISDMLEQNKSLHSLQLEGVLSDGLEKEIDVMMRLNRAGRKLLANATTRQWIDVLSKDDLRDDLDCIVYLLSKNPEMFCGKAGGVTTTPLTSTAKRHHDEVADFVEEDPDLSLRSIKMARKSLDTL